MARFLCIFSILFIAFGVYAKDSTGTKPKKFLIDIKGGKPLLLLNAPRQPYKESGPNKTYYLRGEYFFQGNMTYQARSNEGYNFFFGFSYSYNNLSFTEGLNYTNLATNKFQTFSYSPRSITNTILNHQISFLVGLRKTVRKINMSHKLGCAYSFVTNKNFSNSYTKQESGSYYDGSSWVDYRKDYKITDDFIFKESLCPYYGFDLSFGNKTLQPHIGFDAIYFTNDIIATSTESSFPVLAFGRALMLRFYLGLNLGF